MGSQDLDVAHGARAPGHDELVHDTRVLNLFPASRRSVVGHRNLAAAKPKQCRTLAVVPHHSNSAHICEVHRTRGEYGASNLLVATR
jgi:hypothetical protein